MELESSSPEAEQLRKHWGRQAKKETKAAREHAQALAKRAAAEAAGAGPMDPEEAALFAEGPAAYVPILQRPEVTFLQSLLDEFLQVCGSLCNF